MQKEFLEECLAEGMSLEAIGKKAGKHESTVSHWLKKYGLEAVRAEKHAAKVRPRKTSSKGSCASGCRYAKSPSEWIGAWPRSVTGCGSTS